MLNLHDKRDERYSVSTNDVLREVTEDEVTETNNIRQVELRHKHKTKLEPPDHTKTQYPPRYIYIFILYNELLCTSHFSDS